MFDVDDDDASHWLQSTKENETKLKRLMIKKFIQRMYQMCSQTTEPHSSLTQKNKSSQYGNGPLNYAFHSYFSVCVYIHPLQLQFLNVL